MGAKGPQHRQRQGVPILWRRTSSGPGWNGCQCSCSRISKCPHHRSVGPSPLILDCDNTILQGESSSFNTIYSLIPNILIFMWKIKIMEDVRIRGRRHNAMFNVEMWPPQKQNRFLKKLIS